MSLRWLRQHALQLFNLYVGIDPVVNVADGRQLQEAIRILKASDEVEKYRQTPHKQN